MNVTLIEYQKFNMIYIHNHATVNNSMTIIGWFHLAQLIIRYESQAIKRIS